MGIEQQIHERIRQAIDAITASDPVTAQLAAQVVFSVDKPKAPEHGDASTNAAMALSKALKRPPRDIAALLCEQLNSAPEVQRTEIAGPGFVNLWLRPSAFHQVLIQVQQQGQGYGRAAAATGERVLLEFVSANPTGPLLISHGRGAILGDTVGRLLEARGHRVTREYYVNDFGNQVRLLAASVRAASRGEPPPEGGYGADYVKVLAGWISANAPECLDESAPAGTLDRMCISRMLDGIAGCVQLGGIRNTLSSLRIYFDNWYSEESLHRWGRVAAVLAGLRATGQIVVLDDGAWAFKAAEGQDDKDRVVRKNDGVTYTYFASDIAYHADKAARGFDRLINVLGADHHGYVARLRNALQTVGFDPEHFEVLLYQLVSLLRDGKPYRMGKRLGNLITVDEVVEEIDAAAGRTGAGADALRYYYLARRTETPIELDIELAKRQSLDNPVFYLQYGHARLCAILRRAHDLFGLVPPVFDLALGAKLVHPDELAMLQKLGAFPSVLDDAAAERAPHKVLFYLQELSQSFQSYFTRLKVDHDTILPQSWQTSQDGWQSNWDRDKTLARLAWIDAIRTVYATGLQVLGITAPSRMVRPDGDAQGDTVDEEQDAAKAPS